MSNTTVFSRHLLEAHGLYTEMGGRNRARRAGGGELATRSGVE